MRLPATCSGSTGFRDLGLRIEQVEDGNDTRGSAATAPQSGALRGRSR